MLIDNAFYGHSAALAEYCELPRPWPIWGYLQHGVTTVDPFAGYKMSDRLPKLVWGEPAAQLCRRNHRRNVVAIGAPMLYLDRHRTGSRPTTEHPDGAGTIVYPFHGWEREEVVGSHEQFAKEIDEREPGSVTICLYWNEARAPSVVDAYARRGFRVICNGSRNYIGFLEAQRNGWVRGCSTPRPSD